MTNEQKQEIQELFHLLQPVTPTNDILGADFYTTTGQIIISKQQAYIDALKNNILKCSNIHDVQNLISILQSNNDYFPRFMRTDMEKSKARYAF